jgi:hypothetical protein
VLVEGLEKGGRKREAKVRDALLHQEEEKGRGCQDHSISQICEVL